MRNRNVIMLIALAASACASSSPSTTTTEKKAAAEGTFGVELQACVKLYDASAQVDECADRVRARWSAVDGGAK